MVVLLRNGQCFEITFHLKTSLTSHITEALAVPKV